MGAAMDEPTGFCCIQTAIARFTARHSRWSSRVQPRAFARLELLRGKPVREVLRGRDYSNVILLPGGDEETGLVRPRLVATQLECGNFGVVSPVREAALLVGGERIPTRTLVSTVPTAPNPLVAV